MVAGRAWLGWDGGAAGGALGLGQQRRGIFFIGRRPTRSELFAKLDDTRLVMEPNFTLEVRAALAARGGRETAFATMPRRRALTPRRLRRARAGD